MKAGKITAKLRDAVPVCLMVNGAEVGRYKNIELPDEIKVLPIMDFGFITSLTGTFDFSLYFDQGVLPEKLPEVRAKVTRADKRAAKAAALAKQYTTAASEAVEAEMPKVPDAPTVDTAEEPQAEAPEDEPQAMDEAPVAIELIAEMPKKKRGRPKATEVHGEQHSA